MQINFDIELTDSQTNVRNVIQELDTRFMVCKMSRQCGKSILAEVLAIETLCKHNSYSAYITPTFALGEKIFDELVQILTPTGLLKKANASKMLIETIFGSKLKFFSFQNANAIRGFTVKDGYLFLDEAAFYPDKLPDGSDPFGVIFPLIKAHLKKNKILMISTPNGKRGLFYESYMKALSKVEGWKCYSADIYQDQLLTEDEIQFIKESMSELAFRQEFLVEFLENGLTYFLGFDKCFTKFKYDDSLPQYIGVDLSANGKDETIVTKINSKNQVKQYSVKGTLDSKYQQISNIINATANLKNAYIENNGIGAVMINEIQKLVKNKNLIQEFNTTNKTKNEILSAVSVDIAKGEIYFDKEDTQLYSQFSTFTAKYSKTGQVQLEALPGYHDDRIMSLGIAHQAKEKGTVLGAYVIQFGPRTTHKIRR